MQSADIAGDIFFPSLMCEFVVLLTFFDLLDLLEKSWKDVSLQHVWLQLAFLLLCIKDLMSDYCF